MTLEIIYSTIWNCQTFSVSTINNSLSKINRLTSYNYVLALLSEIKISWVYIIHHTGRISGAMTRISWVYTPSKKKLLACSTWNFLNRGVTFFGHCSQLLSLGSCAFSLQTRIHNSLWILSSPPNLYGTLIFKSSTWLQNDSFSLNNTGYHWDTVLFFDKWQVS